MMERRRPRRKWRQSRRRYLIKMMVGAVYKWEITFS